MRYYSLGENVLGVQDAINLASESLAAGDCVAFVQAVELYFATIQEAMGLEAGPITKEEIAKLPAEWQAFYKTCLEEIASQPEPEPAPEQPPLISELEKCLQNTTACPMNYDPICDPQGNVVAGNSCELYNICPPLSEEYLSTLGPCEYGGMPGIPTDPTPITPITPTFCPDVYEPVCDLNNNIIAPNRCEAIENPLMWGLTRFDLRNMVPCQHVGDSPDEPGSEEKKNNLTNMILAAGAVAAGYFLLRD